MMTEIQPGDERLIAIHLVDEDYVERSSALLVDYTNAESLKLSKITCTVLHKSGIVKGVGPRYCPSIEDKSSVLRTKNFQQFS